MSELHKLPFKLSTADLVNCDTSIRVMQNNDPFVNSSVQAAIYACNNLMTIMGKYMIYNDIAKFMQNEYSLPFTQDSYDGNWYPIKFMTLLPNGKWSSNNRLFSSNDPNFPYEFDPDFNVIEIQRNYGTADILNYSTDPLQYLSFRCLPHEKIEYTSLEDEGLCMDYNGFDPAIFGVELEVERKTNTPKGIERMVVDDLGNDYVILKSDGSLQNGFEIVTAPATIGFHIKAWDKFFANSSKFLSSYGNPRCGMHVHISRKCLTPLHLGKLITFYNNHENRDFITTLAGRNSDYSRFNEDKLFHIKSKLISQIEILMKQGKSEDKIKELKAKLKSGGRSDCTAMLQELSVGGERYSAVNLCKKATVEIRIFKGNVSKVGMLKNLEFVAATVAFTREATFRTKPLDEKEIAERILKRKENTDYALHYEYFLDWLKKDTSGNYNNLKIWLQTHKVTNKFKLPKQTDKTPLDKRIIESEVMACA